MSAKNQQQKLPTEQVIPKDIRWSFQTAEKGTDSSNKAPWPVLGTLAWEPIKFARWLTFPPYSPNASPRCGDMGLFWGLLQTRSCLNIRGAYNNPRHKRVLFSSRSAQGLIRSFVLVPVPSSHWWSLTENPWFAPLFCPIFSLMA